MHSCSVYHDLSWVPQKPKSPVKSVPAAEILASSERIDEEIFYAATYSEIMSMYIRMRLFVE